MKLGGWTSLCFLLYWCRLELIIPVALTRAWAAQQKAFAKTFNISNVQTADISFDLSF